MAQTPNPGKPPTGGVWVEGPNSDDETMIWEDGLGQYLSFVCFDEHFTVEALFSKTVTGKSKLGRLYLGDGSNDGHAKVYSDKAEVKGYNNSFYFFVPFTAAFLEDLEATKKMTVEVGGSRITPNPPPENVLKAFIAGCGNWQLSDEVSAPENLPFPAIETANSPEVAMSAVASGAPVSAWRFRDSLIGGGYGPEMVALPAGKFIMGAPKTDRKAALDEIQLPVRIGYPFAVGQYPVTVHEYLACAAAGGCRLPEWKEAKAVVGPLLDPNAKVDPFAPNNPYERLGLLVSAPASPVVGISWEDAKAYAAWLSRKTGQRYRLLTEAEWEYAARAGSTTTYPWGDKIGVNNANCGHCGSLWDDESMSPVGSFAPNAFGLYDMIGNVEEWVEDCYAPRSPAHPSDGSAYVDSECRGHVTRGGAFYDGIGQLRSASRSMNVSDRENGLGFRIARTLPH
ncbi:formylglycine-generating enzyme family protein [Caulobacter vibrioides]|uniref:formylglycine-generating enzyme family protein n=1 Tax=Caulobacter vibrioides TaxID=155892 RepID=UPI001E626C76|nr:formylglycine-generating enzyme family protein [Caulobacter vibrioides]